MNGIDRRVGGGRVSKTKQKKEEQFFFSVLLYISLLLLVEGDRRVHVRLHRLRLLLADGVRPGQHPHGRHHRRRGERPQEGNQVHVSDVRIHQDVVLQSASIYTSIDDAASLSNSIFVFKR